MVTIGVEAPDFTAPLVGEETDPFTLSDVLGSGPVVLAFFPAAFSSTCTVELCTFRDDHSRFDELGATVFGISTDLPYALSRFRSDHEIDYSFVSDNDGSIIDVYDVVETWDHIALRGVAQRAVFVVDTGGVITYAWRADNPGEEPDYEAVAAAVEDAS